MDKRTALAIQRANKKRGAVKDRRRVKVTTPAVGVVQRLAPESATGTLHRGQVKLAPDDPLRDASYNSKLGGDVLVGRDKGAILLQLTLEERATCPKTCSHWRSCYGNAAPFTPRWKPGARLERAIERQVADLTSVSPIKVRLHHLGDFYSVDYARFWLRLLGQYDALSVFGFTAWDRDTDIGREIALGRTVFGHRWAMRHSGVASRWGSFSIDYPTERKLLGDALVCPEQRHANDENGRPVHCGSCGACWETDRCIVFIEH